MSILQPGYTGPFWRAVTARLTGIGVCTELCRVFTLDEDPELAANMWSVLRAGTWDVSALEMLGAVCPLAPYMAMITKLVDGDACRALLHRGALSTVGAQSIAVFFIRKIFGWRVN